MPVHSSYRTLCLMVALVSAFASVNDDVPMFENDGVVPELMQTRFDSGDCCGGTISEEAYRRVPSAAERGRHVRDDFSQVCKAKGTDGCSKPCSNPFIGKKKYCNAGQVCMKASNNHCVNLCGTAKNGFLAISHMANTIKSVDWAISEGANGVEIDLQYDGTTPTKFQHSPDKGVHPCDCTCAPVAMRPSRFICKATDMGCTANANPATAMLSHLAKTNLALVYMDNKLDTYQDNKWNAENNIEAGKKAAELYKKLFEQGYKGKLLVGVPQTTYLKFLESVKSVLDQTSYKDRVFYTVDMETDAGGAEKAINALKTLGTKNLIYSVGISACATDRYYPWIKAAVAAKNRGDVQEVLIWTIDNRASMQEYLNRGVTGILSNYPGYAQAEACQANKVLAIQ